MSKILANMGENLFLSVNNDINGLKASVNDGSTSAYMWEWYVL